MHSIEVPPEVSAALAAQDAADAAIQAVNFGALSPVVRLGCSNGWRPRAGDRSR